jgi:hypothetical protein
MIKLLPTLDVLANQVRYENEEDFPTSILEKDKINLMAKKLLDKHGFGLSLQMAQDAIVGEIKRLKINQ